MFMFSNCRLVSGIADHRRSAYITEIVCGAMDLSKVNL